MPGDFIGIDTSKELGRIIASLDKLDEYSRAYGTEEANAYIVRYMQSSTYPPAMKPGERFVWSSEKQRRWYFATHKPPYKRTQGLSKGWKTLGVGAGQMVVNEKPYADYVMGWKQIVGHLVRNWPIVAEVLEKITPQIVRQFDAGVKNAIKALRLG